MKFIKTEYGEWFNPSLVKHFYLHFENAEPRGRWFVYADDVLLIRIAFQIESRPSFTRPEQEHQEWETKWVVAKKNARAQAIQWLDKLVAELNKEDKPCGD